MKRVLLICMILCPFLAGVKGGAEPIIAIHGFLATSRSMLPLKKGFRGSGHTIHLWDYPSRNKRIQEHATALVAFLQHQAAACPSQPIHFVTHSIGALVLRAALQLEGCPEEAKRGRAVLVAPPNQGSRLARDFSHLSPIRLALGNGAGWELMHYTPEHMASLGNFPQTMEVLVIAGTRSNHLYLPEPNDGWISVEETYLNQPFYFQSMPFSHGSLLSSPRVLREIRNFLS